MSEAPPPTVTEDLPVTIATNTTIESTQTRINQSDFPEVKLDTMHPIISEAAVADTMATEDKSTDDLMKTTSDELMTALEELNTVIGTSNTSSLGVVADHMSNVVKDKSHGNSNITDNGSHDKGSRSNSHQSDYNNKASRSSSRQATPVVMTVEIKSLHQLSQQELYTTSLLRMSSMTMCVFIVSMVLHTVLPVHLRAMYHTAY